MENSDRQIVLIIHNVRSCHNVGSLLRTADGVDAKEVYMTGYTPYPAKEGHERLPHIATKMDRQISKTALGAEKSVKWQYHENIDHVIAKLKGAGYKVFALEQASEAQMLVGYNPPEKTALIVGNEVGGLPPEVLSQCDTILEIPMLGQKESLNVATAAAITLHHLRFY